MLYKGVLAIGALAALSLAMGLAFSHSDLAGNSVPAYMSQLDFDRVFGNFDMPFDKSKFPSEKTKREMLRREGMKRANSATSGQAYVLLNMRIVESHVALSLFGVDETLYTRDLAAPVTFVMSKKETPLISSEAGETELAGPVSPKLAAAATAFEVSPSSATASSSFHTE